MGEVNLKKVELLAKLEILNRLKYDPSKREMLQASVEEELTRQTDISMGIF